MATTHPDSQFIDPGPLIDEELHLVLLEITPADPARGRVPTYRFQMQVNGQRAGRLNLRIGNTREISLYYGHVGYAVEPEHRGHHYAQRACRLICPLARAHGLTELWIICNPENTASRRTCERLGAEFVDITPLPEDSDLYRQGDREGCRYRIYLT